MPIPRKDGEAKIYPEKITNIVSEISNLTLAEVSDLNTLLKVRQFDAFQYTMRRKTQVLEFEYFAITFKHLLYSSFDVTKQKKTLA